MRDRSELVQSVNMALWRWCCLRSLLKDGGAKHSTENQQSGHAIRPGLEIKGGIRAKNGVSKRLRCGIVEKKS